MSDKPPFFEHAKPRRKGLTYDEFELGRVIEHHWGRTISETESIMFSSMTLNFNPTYFNVEYAKGLGYERIPLNPYLIYLTIFGLSVEDLTEGGRVGALVGMEQLKFHAAGFPGDTFVARSTVLAKRASSKNPEMGLVTWLTEGFNQHGVQVLEYQRTNMMNIRS
jgi:itaconyl-CoA hydratase